MINAVTNFRYNCWAWLKKLSNKQVSFNEQKDVLYFKKRDLKLE